MGCITTISGGFGVSCKAPSGKIKDKLILINVDDIDMSGVTYKTTLNGESVSIDIITALPLKSGKQGYLVEGLNGSIIARENISRGTYRANLSHEIEFVAWEIDAKALSNIKKLLTAKVVGVFESNGQFRVAGWSTGLQIREGSADTSDTDKGGLFTLILDMEQAPNLMPVFGVYTGTSPSEVYDYAASKTAFEALLIA
ncbi:MAG: hypothetical protein KatS3mg031_2883 [Chitinophagales bacterium]|nr:MAG: hypothetical protein KatS3mg031_2883 [Chitinophagales bacterium]